jgi:hypothetical protein
MVSPPLVRLVAAIPLLVDPPETDWTHAPSSRGIRSEHEVGADFVRANGVRTLWYFTLARWACVPFSALGAFVCYRWAHLLYGSGAGLLATTIWCASPTLLAHGQIATPDMGVTALGVWACYLFWQWLREPAWSRSLWAGIGLGLAELAKSTAVVFFICWPLMWIGYRWLSPCVPRKANNAIQLAQLAAALVVAVNVLNLGYGYSGSFRPIGDYVFSSKLFKGEPTDAPVHAVGGNRLADSWLAVLPVPLPAEYVMGIDLQRCDFEAGFRSYVRGQWSNHGWWWYYLFGLGVKSPLGSWCLLALTIVVTLADRRYSAHWRDEAALCIPGLALFVLISSQSGFSHHVRYVLPVLPFLIIWLSKLALAWRFHHQMLQRAVALSVAWSLSSNIYVYPHSLSYFNELAGGPLGGHRFLVDSNIDWGQDLLYLKHWLDEHPQAHPIGLAYFGAFDPTTCGIEFTLPPAPPTEPRLTPDVAEVHPRYYAVSVNFLRGYHFRVPFGNGQWGQLSGPDYTYLLPVRPTATAGYSIYIYHLNPDQLVRLRRDACREDFDDCSAANAQQH